jgi:hypothetical protein
MSEWGLGVDGVQTAVTGEKTEPLVSLDHGRRSEEELAAFADPSGRQGRRRVRLRIEVDEQHPRPRLGEAPGRVHRQHDFLAKGPTAPAGMKFLIDECLSPRLARRAIEDGYTDSSHVLWIGHAGRQDWNLLPVILAGDWTFVTKNSYDFRGPVDAPGIARQSLVVARPTADPGGSFGSARHAPRSVWMIDRNNT